MSVLPLVVVPLALEIPFGRPTTYTLSYFEAKDLATNPIFELPPAPEIRFKRDNAIKCSQNN
jgi:hypothetical protein